MISKFKNGQVNLIRGKAYAHIHRRQMWHIMKNSMLDVTVPWKAGDIVDSCVSNAKKAVGDLGLALDYGVLDEDGSYLLDLAMLNHVQVKKQLKDCQRCLLCRRRGVKLKESHTVPKFLFKELSNQANKGLDEFGLDIDGAGLFQNTSGKFRVDTSNTALKYTLLCERCEQCLSQNGEDQFRRAFLPPINSRSDEIQSVSYNSSIYSFCLGVLFRSFVNNAFFFYTNADEIYSLLVACRQHLIQLPAKVTEKKEIPNPPPVDGIKHVILPNVYIIINPFELHVPNSNILPLATSMVSGVCTWYLTTPLNKEPKTHLCHAVVVRMAVCNVIVPLSPAQSSPLDDIYRIDPHGGVYPVLPEISRWSATPQGIFQAIVDNSIIVMKQYQQVLSGMKTTKGDSRKADSYINTFEQIISALSLEQEPIDLSSLHTMPIPPEEVELISLYVSRSAVQVKLLPDRFDISYTPPKVTLKEGYTLLYHTYDKDTDVTSFFVSNSSDILSGKLIVLTSVTEKSENYNRVEGAHLHMKVDGSICVTGHLQEPTTERLKQSQYSRLSKVTERVMKSVDTLLQKCGSPSMLLLYASIQTRLANTRCR